MEEEMEVELSVFEAREIDLDYEFDAACFFDFTREESLAEAREAELWFESAPNYPPSPFVAKLFLREDILLGNVTTTPKTRVTSSLENDSDNSMGAEFSISNVEDRACAVMSKGIFTNLKSVNLQKAPNQPLNLTTGLKFYDHIAHDKLEGSAKSTKKSHPRSSTLMKPTTSHLAKQNRPVQVGNSRFQTRLFQNGERSLCNSSVVESQAAKRQKLEGGHLHKVADVKSQTHLVHKAPKRDGTIDKNSQLPRLRLTIPREPNLETAHRAQRIRPKVIAEQEKITTAAHRFKARPLNRKILKASALPLPKKSMPRLPEFQEQDKAGSCSVLGNGNREFERLSVMNTLKQDGFDIANNFKARPLNKKIFSGKGEIGVFRNSKQETTVPMEFNFQTEKKIRLSPPADLFSKMTRLAKERTSAFGDERNLCGNDECINEAGNHLSVRSLGIR